jgi:hypothetical protein
MSPLDNSFLFSDAFYLQQKMDLTHPTQSSRGTGLVDKYLIYMNSEEKWIAPPQVRTHPLFDRNHTRQLS